MINLLKFYLTFTSLALGICLINRVTPSLATQAKLSSKSSTSSQINWQQRNIQVTFEPPDRNEPDNTVGGASRDGGGICLSENLATTTETPALELLPLTPESNYGLTISEHPTFYAYIPQSNDVKKIFFSLRDRDQKTLYQTEFAIEKTGVIIHFSLSNTAPPLELDKDYEWSMVLMCNQTMKPDSPRISAWVKRIEVLDIPFHAQDYQNSLEIAAFYAQNGLWYDALNSLGNLLRHSGRTSTDYAEQWQKFLSQDLVGLGAIANQPLLEEALMAENEQ